MLYQIQKAGNITLAVIALTVEELDFMTILEYATLGIVYQY